MPIKEPLKLKAKWARYRREHKEQIAAYKKRNRRRFAKAGRAYWANYARRHPDLVRAKDAKVIKEMHYKYIKVRLGIKTGGRWRIPQGLIEAKRAQLLLWRATR
jgi:hypothetical protein